MNTENMDIFTSFYGDGVTHSPKCHVCGHREDAHGTSNVFGCMLCDCTLIGDDF